MHLHYYFKKKFAVKKFFVMHLVIHTKNEPVIIQRMNQLQLLEKESA